MKRKCLVWLVKTISRVVQISTRGIARGARDRSVSVPVLAHIREQYSLSLGSYGRLRMTTEFKEAGLAVGESRVRRLMTRRAVKPARIWRSAR